MEPEEKNSFTSFFKAGLVEFIFLLVVGLIIVAVLQYFHVISFPFIAEKKTVRSIVTPTIPQPSQGTKPTPDSSYTLSLPIHENDPLVRNIFVLYQIRGIITNISTKDDNTYLTLNRQNTTLESTPITTKTSLLKSSEGKTTPIDVKDLKNDSIVDVFIVLNKNTSSWSIDRVILEEAPQESPIPTQ